MSHPPRRRCRLRVVIGEEGAPLRDRAVEEVPIRQKDAGDSQHPKQVGGRRFVERLRVQPRQRHYRRQPDQRGPQNGVVRHDRRIR